MRICLISVEIFAWGKYGGFGRATRLIGRELARRGHEVFAVVPRRPGQGAREALDGITVLGFPPGKPRVASRLLRQVDAELYHSCEPSLTTYLAMRAMPHRHHIATIRDPRDSRDWLLELARPSLNHLQVIHNYLFENNWLVRRSVRRMDAVFATAECLRPKVKKIYRLQREPRFLPTPVTIPDAVVKADRPTVCYVARMDRRKRPQLFFQLAPRFPEVRFLAVGKSRDPAWEQSLRARYEDLPNVDMLGFVDQFNTGELSRILARSWILINTSTREGLPNALIEAAAHRCAILSQVNPDDFAAEFGYHAAAGDFARGLAWLLENDRWRRRGEIGYHHISRTFELDHAVALHEAVYREVLDQAVLRR